MPKALQDDAVLHPKSDSDSPPHSHSVHWGGN